MTENDIKSQALHPLCLSVTPQNALLGSYFGLYTLFSCISSLIYTAFLILTLVYAHLAGIEARSYRTIRIRPEFCTYAAIIIPALEAVTLFHVPLPPLIQAMLS